jgi:exodeoxyribonuclease VII small subunit
MATKKTYESAYAELEQIMSDLQKDGINVDDLAQKVARAAELLKFCSDRLRVTEGAVQKVVDQLED